MEPIQITEIDETSDEETKFVQALMQGISEVDAGRGIPLADVIAMLNLEWD